MRPSSVIEIPYKADSIEWAALFADQPGFAFLDSRKRHKGSGDVDIICALPERLYNLVDYSSITSVWIAEIEQDLTDTGQSDGAIVIGYLDFESASTAIGVPASTLQPATAALYRWHLCQHHEEERAYVVFDAHVSTETRSLVKQRLAQQSTSQNKTDFNLDGPFSADTSPEDFLSAVEQIRQYIGAGDCYQVNFAHRFSASFKGSLFGAYRKVRDAAPGDFSAFLNLTPGHNILSLSPERFMSVEDGDITAQPIKGTAPRAKDLEEDQRIAEALCNSPKDRAENVMIVDLLRNDLGKLCKTGSVSVPSLCALQSFDNVHHLVSTVTGKLRAHCTPGQALVDCSPGGSITGAPKRRAVEIIKELERAPRGIYCGSVFASKANGWLQSSIAIRTVEAVGNRLYCWGGGGITFDSIPEAEYQETLDKVRVFMEALED